MSDQGRAGRTVIEGNRWKQRALVLKVEPLKPELCTRWGTGPDRCIKPFEHSGPDEDAEGNTTETLAAAILGRNA